ncbi:hypothetical protein [Streptomyces sp. H27-H5]|uniref:hypothetical protein n=1 Tax=Streptomyces sp. H27-H5 TaxID=2996460 RepID=UPI002270CC42|nr:hypothetical protein [Streptomyces sp. H27-H5]MCY0959310.1 hypothetical protein [Streptomyces sp. H27-H5]
MNVPAGGRPYEIHEDGPGSMIFASLLAGALGVGTFWAWTPWEQESLFATVVFWGWAILCLLSVRWGWCSACARSWWGR